MTARGRVKGVGISTGSEPALDIVENALRSRIRELFANRADGVHQGDGMHTAVTDGIGHMVERSKAGSISLVLSDGGYHPTFRFHIHSVRHAHGIARIIGAYADELGRLQAESASGDHPGGAAA